jgi:signal transduction histidine kinase
MTVLDDGPGIAPEQSEAVFVRFARLDARNADSGGAGLGLAIARDIAVRHGGTLTLQPTDEPGARFGLILPASSG